MRHVLHAMYRWLLRRIRSNIATVTMLVGIALVGWLVWSLYPELSGSDAAVRRNALEILLVAVGASSVLFLGMQLRQQANWHKVLSYHQFFHDLPTGTKTSDMTACLARLSIPKPTAVKPVSVAQVKAIREDVGAESGSGRLTAETAIKAYLDDFEEFCAAVNSGVVSDWYALNIEGSRVIRAYFAFAPLIEQLRKEAEQDGSQFRSKYYDELEDVAKRWRQEREVEYRALQGVKNRFRDWFGMGNQV